MNSKNKFQTPSENEITSIAEFYANRLKHYGYSNRDDKSFNLLARYFAKYYFGICHEVPQKKYKGRFCRPEKSLLLYGPCGSGKTFALQILSQIFKIKLIFADQLSQWFAIYGEAGFWDLVKEYDSKDLIIDDLGSERNLKSFGNEPVIGEFIVHRERLFRNYGTLTFYTTNAINSADIAKRYGDRVASRILGMAEAIQVKASDARKVTK